MLRKLTALAAALVIGLTLFVPATADAQHRGYRDQRGDHYRHHDHDRRRGHYYRDDDDDAVAAGIIGLVLGLAIGSLASQPPREGYPQGACSDNYQRCAPPQGYYGPRGYDGSGLEGGYDPRFGGGSAYQQDYGYAPPQRSYDPYAASPPPQCSRRERQWDRYANRYVTVDVPC